MSARALSLPAALLGALLLAPPARAQDAPPQPAPQPASVIVVLPSPPGAYAPPPAYAPPQAYAPPEAYALPPGYPPPPMYYPAPGYAPPPYPMLPPLAAPPPVQARGLSAKLYAGPAYERVFGTSIPGAEIGAFLGGVRGASGWYGGVDAFLGQMSYGLFTFAFRPGATWEARLDRVHLGLGLGFAFVGVQRATTGGFMEAFGAGASAFATVDLWQGERSALFLGGKIRADILDGSDASGNAPILWGPSAALGWRYF